MHPMRIFAIRRILILEAKGTAFRCTLDPAWIEGRISVAAGSGFNRGTLCSVDRIDLLRSDFRERIFRRTDRHIHCGWCRYVLSHRELRREGNRKSQQQGGHYVQQIAQQGAGDLTRIHRVGHFPFLRPFTWPVLRPFFLSIGP